MTCGKRSAVKCVRLSCGELSIVLCAWLSMRRFCQNPHREGSLQSKNLCLFEIFLQRFARASSESVRAYHSPGDSAQDEIWGVRCAGERILCRWGSERSELHSAGPTDLPSQQLKVACIPLHTARTFRRKIQGLFWPSELPLCFANPACIH